MKAAEYAVEAGHSVVLFEKEAALGGILRYTDRERFKADIQRFKDNLAVRLRKMGVEIRFEHHGHPSVDQSRKPRRRSSWRSAVSTRPYLSPALRVPGF